MDIGRADIVLSAMLFMDEHVRAILPTLAARREACDAMVGCLSAGEVVKTTKLGRFDMSGNKRSALDFLKKLRGKPGQQGNAARQMALVRKLPKILRFIPGSAQDVRAYFLTLQYWLPALSNPGFMCVAAGVESRCVARISRSRIQG